MFDIRIEIDTTHAVEQLESKAEGIVSAVRAELIAQAGNLLAYIKDEGMMRAGLHQRSGNLKRSGFTESPGYGSSGEYTAYVGFGRTVPYARILNYGGIIRVPEVEGKLMVFNRTFGGPGADVPWAGSAGPPIFTYRHRAFSVLMPERNYLETSAEVREPIIREGLRDAIEAAIHA